MCTTHDRIAEICAHVRAISERYKEFTFYPCMPYAQKYANAVTENGVISALAGMLPRDGAINALFKGGMSIAKRDLAGIGELLIDTEMRMFDGCRTPVVFLQNIVTDLLLGLKLHHLFRVFSDYVMRKHNAEAGFITMNMPMLLDALDEVEIDNPIVCSNINKVGFRMCGGLAAYRHAIANRRFRPVAMSVLASGAVPPREAIEFIAGLRNVESVVFGASTRAHIEQTKGLLDEVFVGNRGNSKSSVSHDQLM